MRHPYLNQVSLHMANEFHETVATDLKSCNGHLILYLIGILITPNSRATLITKQRNNC